MYFTRILLSIVFVLFASTALAAKPGKILVCHVGNELGSSEETYQDNPDCTIPPEWVGDHADYICPDAGKIDLILVSTKAKHLGNPAHSFEDDTGYLWEDYLPEDGVGDEAADFEEGDAPGIDRGCELLEENLACPCWDGWTEDQMVAASNAIPPPVYRCQVGEYYADAVADSGRQGFVTRYDTNGSLCAVNITSLALSGTVELTEPEGEVCLDEASAIVARIAWCSD